MVTTLYILVNCTMQQSVNGNNKHKVKLWQQEVDDTDDDEDGGFFSWQQINTAVSTAIFQVGFERTWCVDLCSTSWVFFFFSFLKMLKWFHWQMTKRKVSVRIHSSCLVWQVPIGERKRRRGDALPPRRTHPWKIMKQLNNFDRLSIGARSTLA